MKHDLTNQIFGRLKVISLASPNGYRKRWHCICVCGKTKDVLEQNLLNGHVKSCGCLLSTESQKRILKYNNAVNRETHGETKTRLYRIWIGMKSRCYGKTSSSYSQYGLRGIKVCDEWKSSFISFKKWSLENGYSDSLTLDRINVNGDYCPANCRWVTLSVQSFNKRIPDKNTSGCVGVSFNKRQNKWVAYISRNRVFHFLGTFPTKEEAISARKHAETKFFGQQSPTS